MLSFMQVCFLKLLACINVTISATILRDPSASTKRDWSLWGGSPEGFVLIWNPLGLKRKIQLWLFIWMPQGIRLAFFKNENLKKSWTLLQMFINDPLLSSDSFRDNMGGLCSPRGGVQFSLFQMFLLRRLEGASRFFISPFSNRQRRWRRPATR